MMSTWGTSLIRVLLRLLPSGLVVRVLAGPGRGMRWLPESMPHGAWLGTLERGQLDGFVVRIVPGTTVWDVGANVGLYTLPSARATGSSGAVYAFEPVQRNLEYLRQHVGLNRLENVHIVDAAVGQVSGVVRMAAGASPSEASVNEAGALQVRAITLDGWRENAQAPFPSLIKIDVEGAEEHVLAGAFETLKKTRPTIFLSLHGERQRIGCRSILERLSYRIASLQPGASVDVATEWIAEGR